MVNEQWIDMNEQRDEEGNLTPLAKALQAISDDGCHCDSVYDELHTCVNGLCEDALKHQWHQLNQCYELIGRMKQREVEANHATD